MARWRVVVFLPWLALVVLGLAAAGLAARAAPLAALLVPPIQQATWLDAATPSAPNPSPSELRIGRVVGGGERRALLAFNLTELPAGATVTSATLTLHLADSLGGVVPVRIRAANGPWDQTTVTFSTMPGGVVEGGVTVTPSGPSSVDVIADVKAIVQAWANGLARHGFLIEPADSANGTDRFALTGPNAPRLTIDVAAPTSTPTSTSTPAGPTSTPTPSPTTQPTLIPIVTPKPFTFLPFSTPIAYPRVIYNTRITQGFEYDRFTIPMIASGKVYSSPVLLRYDLIAGKETLARFEYSGLYHSGVCQVWRSLGSGNAVVGVVPATPDGQDRFDCWIPGWMTDQPGWYAVRALVNDISGGTVYHDFGGYREFKPTAEYFGMLYVPLIAPVGQFLDSWPSHYTTKVLGMLSDSFSRVYPLRAGVEVIDPAGANPHRAGMRVLLATPQVCPSSFTFDQCNVWGRSVANQLLLLWNWIVNANKQFNGPTLDYVHWGEMLHAVQATGGGQSCWHPQRVGGQSIDGSVGNASMDAGILNQEIAHCLGLVYVGPHAHPVDTAHSSTGDIPNLFGLPLVNFRQRLDVTPFQSSMNPTIYRPDDAQYFEGTEFNRMRQILLANGVKMPQGDRVPQATDKQLLLAGKIDRIGNWTTDLSLVVTSDALIPSPPPTGTHAIVLVDAAGAELVRWPFTVDFIVTHGRPPHGVPVGVTLPYPAGVAAVRIYGGDTLLAELIPPLGGPSVSFGSLITSGDVVTATWSASHPQGAPLSFLVFYSSDDGASRVPLGPATSATSLTLRSEWWAGSDHARLIVLASDGFTTAEAVSPRFHVTRRPPLATITWPDSATPLFSGEPIVLRGLAYDPADGLLSGTQLRWASNLAGPLGISETLPITLSAGVHQLTLQAINSAGLVGQTQVTVTVLAGARPRLQPPVDPLPPLAAQPEPIDLWGCAPFGPPSRTLPIADPSVLYTTTTTHRWLQAERLETGDLRISGVCEALPASPLAGEVLLGAVDRQPLRIDVRLHAGPAQTFLPGMLKGEPLDRP